LNALVGVQHAVPDAVEASIVDARPLLALRFFERYRRQGSVGRADMSTEAEKPGWI
jgi:hypothetical protein